jgi:beta-xylosidase
MRWPRRAVRRPATDRAVLALDADHGDPFVLRSGDRYYLYHTGATAVPVYESVDLRAWTPRGVALDNAGAPAWAARDYWAPEVVSRDGTFFMYVAATSRQPTGAGDDRARRVGVARATSALGPFTWDPEPLVAEWSIDANPFQDRGGDWWLCYSARNAATRYRDGTVGCGIAIDRLLEPDRVAGDVTVILVPDRRWEGNRRGSWYWNEAPCVTPRGDHYCVLYSGGWFGDGTYAVGLATATGLRGPWTKDPGNPLLASGPDVIGPGHTCLTTSPDGRTTFLVYHGRLPGRAGRAVFVDELTWTDDRFELTPLTT